MGWGGGKGREKLTARWFGLGTASPLQRQRRSAPRVPGPSAALSSTRSARSPSTLPQRIRTSPLTTSPGLQLEPYLALLTLLPSPLLQIATSLGGPAREDGGPV